MRWRRRRLAARVFDLGCRAPRTLDPLGPLVFGVIAQQSFWVAIRMTLPTMASTLATAGVFGEPAEASTTSLRTIGATGSHRLVALTRRAPPRQT